MKSQKIGKQEMTLGSFLEALSWGDADCASDHVIRGHRTVFLKSTEFAKLLRTWRTPPRSKRSHRSRPAGGRELIDAFVLEAMLETTSSEMKAVDPLLRTTSDTLTKENLTKFQLDELQHAMRTTAPTLWSFLDLSAYSAKQRAANKHKDPSNIVMFTIANLLYSRTHHCNQLQRVLGIYFKFKGLSAKGCDTLHALGVCMSSKWTTNAVAAISDEAMSEVIAIVEKHQRVMSHDNVQMSFRVFSQRLEKNTQFGSGTAATVYVKKDAPAQDRSLNRKLQHARAVGMKNPLRPLDVLELAEKSYPYILQFAADHVLNILLHSDEFDLASYSEKSSAHLEESPGMALLPIGPETVTLQYMLGTLPIPEASYEDNDRVVAEFLKQLNIKTTAQKKRVSQEEIIYWIGDQLTVDRIRGLQRFCCQEANSYDRLDFIIPIFGWLHLQMAYAKSLHKQYLGTEAGRGLKYAFLKLERKGLEKPSTKGPFHDNLERAIYHVLEAHLRACWLVTSGVEKLEDLRSRSPRELRDLAIRIVDENATAGAIDSLDSGPQGAADPIRQSAMMFIRDALSYVVLDRSIQRGDIGMMEGMLPHLALRFAGGRNSHYVTECLELLQGLEREWPPAVSDLIRSNCWLVNSTGKRNGHTPLDRAQEARIKDIKVTNRSQGPSVNWTYLRTLHPALPVIQAVSHHIEQQFRTWTRYGRHTDPGDAKGIAKLQAAYQLEHIHETCRGRTISTKEDQVKDFYSMGLHTLPSAMMRWVDGRTFERATGEDWTAGNEDDELMTGYGTEITTDAEEHTSDE
ncbi:hypothetical protein OH77DRAFT_1489301 [Trametes cingulata]|nr:hypothetical protein OH77DRAFT_1489301 [Trametes cingulata]